MNAYRYAARMVETVEFNGVKFRRYPEAKQRTDRVYFNPGIADRQRGVRRLHEEVWIAAHGPIPPGGHIHHKDEDPLNNDLSNLEWMSAGEHNTHHHGGVCSDRKREHLEKIRDLAAQWHRSEEGRQWHRQHGIESWENREAVERTCVQCGATFESITKRESDRYCSNACKSAWRRASGLDDVDRTCSICGTTFRVNRYSKIKTCSRACGRKQMSLTKTSRPSVGAQAAAGDS